MTNAEAESKRILKFVISRDALRSLLNAGLLDKEQFERALERVAARYQIDPLTGMALESKKRVRLVASGNRCAATRI